MSDRKEIKIDQVDLNKQKEIMLRLKENNDMEYQKNGMHKNYYMITFGCQQNVSDSEKLMGMLDEMGYHKTEKRDEADVVIINTCCVRENAELKLYGNIGAFKQLKLDKPGMLLCICGCMMEQEHAVATIKKKYKHVDLVFGTHNLYKFPELLERSMNEVYTLVDIMNTEGIIVEDIPVRRDDKFKAWVTIMYGCNNFCSYCIVPHVRGRERSRDPKDIISEIKQLIADGCKEITLLGQNVNSYGKDLNQGIDFADLLKMVNDLEGLERLRFLTSHPKDISDKLIETMGQCKKVCEQLHLPFQAGSNKILKAMNRKYTKEEYLQKIDKVKEMLPGVALSTDVIVGFPGETDDDFEETLDVINKVGFDQAFTYIYSRRIGTAAATMENQINDEQKHKNFEKLVKLQNDIGREINETYLNKIVEVLVEGPSKSDSTKFTGRSRTGKVINFSGQNAMIGQLVHVKITDIYSWFLNGEMVENSNSI
jgi:tRNA-2-methylthio-N6-dimethylallyladenosine synthase